MEKKNVYYIVAAVVVIVLLLVIVMKKPMEEPAEVPVAPEPEPEVTEPATPEPTQEPEVPEEGEDIQYGARGILSDVKCEEGLISAIISNVQEETMSVLPNSYKSDLIIQVNGMRMQDFTCDKESVAANEYTYCEDLMGKLGSKIRPAGNEVAVWFKSDQANRGVVVVDCE